MPPTGRSLAIGVNRVDPVHYVGFSRQLYCCERDAQVMQYIAERSGFQPLPMLLGECATRSSVEAGIARAAAELTNGDFFLISFAGHGAQVPDITGTERDGRNETWCLYDQQLVDHQLFADLGAFEPGVRVLIVSDCCHSGTEPESGFSGRSAPPGMDPRELPRSLADSVYNLHATVYDAQTRLGDRAHRESALRASVMLLASCLENELSYEGARLGYFTDALLRTWNEGTFAQDHDAFVQDIIRATPRFQTPILKSVSADDQQFRGQRPFAL